MNEQNDTERLQLLFDRAVSGVLRQGKLARRFERCFYRLETPEGTLWCGIGHLIPVEFYCVAMEGLTSTQLYRQYGIHGVKEDDLDFVARIQYAHDMADSIEHFRRRAREVASAYDLDTSVLD